MWHFVELSDLINVINVIKIDHLNTTNYDYNVTFDFVCVCVCVWIELPKKIEVNYKFHVFVYWF